MTALSPDLSAHFRDACRRHLGSPIEALFLRSLIVTYLSSRNHLAMDVVCDGDVPDGAPDGLYVLPQFQVGQYRVDFLLRFRFRAATASIAVECDGHAFHARTKEQAAHDKRRDRAINLAGYRTLRFTGSEIHSDARSCAEQAVVLLMKILLEPHYPGGWEAIRL